MSRGAAAALTGLVLLAEGAGAEARVADFALLDHRGAHHRLYRHAASPAVVIFVQGNGCPIARKSVPVLRSLRDSFGPRGVVFWMLNASPQDDVGEIAAEAEAWGIDLPILRDDAQLVAAALGVTRTGEALVIDPAGWAIRYRGPPDDRLSYETERPARGHYLRDALEAVLAGRPVATPRREAPGGLIRDDAPPAAHDVSYARDVAPILERRCRSCHRPGGVAGVRPA